MRNMRINVSGLGFTPEEIEIAGRVAMAIHAEAKRTTPPHGKRSTLCKMAVADTLLPAGGWVTQIDRAKMWRQWLRDQGKVTANEAHAKRIEMGMGPRRQQTCKALAKLEEEGRIRWVHADRYDPGMVVWIGGSHE